MKKYFAFFLIAISTGLSISCKKVEHLAEPDVHSISGLIKGSNLQLSDVVVSIGSIEVNSSDAGRYTLEDLRAGSYKLIPRLSGYRFVPENIDVIVDEKSVTGINFMVVPDSMTATVI